MQNADKFLAVEVLRYGAVKVLEILCDLNGVNVLLLFYEADCHYVGAAVWT